MREALKEAEIALAHEEIPIGCVIVERRRDHWTWAQRARRIAASGHACGGKRSRRSQSARRELAFAGYHPICDH